MATFKALNIESDDEEGIEVDNTKEIQIEEALKLYQDALKLHSEGPASYDDAATAYHALFESEIFKYPESQSELKRLDLYGPPPEHQDDFLEHQGHVVAGYSGGTEENALGTLPQLIHLAQKNYGQFLMESLQYKILNGIDVSPQDIETASIAALNSFVESLDKDDTDPDVWRRTAAVGSLLGSSRIPRYCLETVLDADDAGIEAVLSISGLAESLAGQQLRQLVMKLQDRLSLLQAPLSFMKKRKLSRLLKERLGTYEAVALYQQNHPTDSSVHQPLRSILTPPSTWADFGDVILRHAVSEVHGKGANMPGLAIAFDLSDHSTEPDVMLIDDPIAGSSPQRPPSLSHSLPSTSAALSSLAIDQFLGMDDGLPTCPVSAFPIQMLSSATINISSEPMTLVTRKRSTDAAGFQDSTDPGRSRSKRVRARESNVDQSILEEDVAVDTTQASYQLADLDFVDGLLVETVDKLLAKLGLPPIGLDTNDRKGLRGASNKPDSEVFGYLPAGATQRASLDLYNFFDAYSDNLARTLLVANNDLDSASETHVQPSGLMSVPSNQSKQIWPELDQSDGLQALMQSINKQWLHTNQVIFLWLSRLINPIGSALLPSISQGQTSYSTHKWQESFKTIVVRVIVTLDDYIFRELESKIEGYDRHLLRRQSQNSSPHHDAMILADVEMIQTLFELHLDVYSLIKEPNSGVDRATVVIQGDRTNRWANIARDAMNIRSSILDLPSLKDRLNLRYLWAATHHINISGDVSRDHTISCWQELRSIFIAVGSPIIELQNNAIMPHLSLESIDRELSRLTTQDFFLKVFDAEQQDFTIVIESLEPLLEMLHEQGANKQTYSRNTSDTDSNTLDDEGSDDSASGYAAIYSTVASPELINFLKNSNTLLRVSLWQRLREAYDNIDYQPMVICCYFRTIEMLVGELKSSSFIEKTLVERQTILLKFLRLSHDLLSRILTATDKHENIFECMDMNRIESGIGAVIDLMKILHSYTLFHDDVRVGLRSVPSTATGSAIRSFSTVTKVLQEMQTHCWMLVYKLLGEAITQNGSKIEAPDNALFDFLRSVHNVLGARSLCGKFNRAFLKFLKQEYLRMRAGQSVTSSYFDIEFAQVLYDLYGLKLFLNPNYDQQEHNCQHELTADKHSAMQAVDLLLTLQSKMKMNDLLKHPIRDTIEKVHALVTRKKPSDAIMKNREVIRNFLKSPINPSDLFQCIHGVGDLTLYSVPAEHAILAAKGWYFLMGHIHLSRFRSQKRNTATATDDLDIAVALFMQELEYSMDSWETWFRIAQAYDSKIEEHVSWSAEKLSSNAAEIVQLQKAAIHCYKMAVALAMRSAEPGPETTAKLAEMFADFAMRLYSSTREPFDMQAFSLGEVGRYFSTETLIKGIPFRPMGRYLAWKIAKGFFERAINLNPDKWILHYHLAKCLWKMHSRYDEAREIDNIILPEEVTGELVKAIKLLPAKKDPKRASSDPIIEPHYKLVSVVHKMVIAEDLEPAEGSDILMATPYAAKIDHVSELSDWESYILKVLKNLRTADKSHWQHRMIARTAQIVYHDGFDKASILAAKHELTKQMFTKTMQLQIWKPEHQRPGRHFVYSARYIRFFTRLLDTLNDRASLDGLARRVRKRQADIFEHGAVWQDICQSYLRVLRVHGDVPLGHETAIFSGINHEDFLKRKEALEHWCQDPKSETPTLSALQEALELKKVNAGLMKAGIIDDLVGDAYAYLYDTVGRRLWAATEAQEAEKTKQDTAEAEVRAAQEQATTQQLPDIAATTVVTAPSSPKRNPMMNLSHLMNIDGALDSNTPSVITQQTSAVQTPTGEHTPAPGSQQTDGQAAPQQSRRKIGVGRREIRLCAEACVARPATTAGPATTSSTFSTTLNHNTRTDLGNTQEVQVIIEARPRSSTATTNNNNNNNIKNNELQRRASRSSLATGNGGRSGGGNTASDADDESDESELSDVDEELVTQGTPGKPKQPAQTKPLTVIQPMFPGLARASNKGGGVGLMSSDVEDDRGDEEEEEEGVMGEGEEEEDEEEEEQEGGEGGEGEGEEEEGEEEDVEGIDNEEGEEDELEEEDVEMGEAEAGAADDEEEGEGEEGEEEEEEGEEEEEEAEEEAEEEVEDDGDEEEDEEESQPTSAAWHNQQARLAAAASAGTSTDDSMQH